MDQRTSMEAQNMKSGFSSRFYFWEPRIADWTAKVDRSLLSWHVSERRCICPQTSTTHIGFNTHLYYTVASVYIL